MQKTYSILLSLTLGLALVVIVLGAYTRLSDAGLGCPDWPGCYGHLGVPEQVDAEQFERPLEHAKAWKEMIHRYAAGMLGVLILALFVLRVRFRRYFEASIWIPTLLLATVIFQAALGMWTVTHLLSPPVVTAHLLGGFTTLALVWWLWLQRHVPRFSTLYGSIGAVRGWALGALLLLIAQIMLGGWTSTHYAAVACGVDFPLCQGQWWPASDFRTAFSFEWQAGVNYEFGTLENPARTAIHLTHRLGALLVLLYLGGLALWLIRRRSVACGIVPYALLVLLVVQVSLGISNVVFALPLVVATLHTLGAALLLLAVLALNHCLYPAH
ncbi:COX15/CtaA family protein [Thiothrix subterranea]|uniref:COX15/CtaA family protein n=2 Tax=Thiothrix TaxID=1030 RepID=A0AA51MR81_9GAMM|nr:COX15/CtaA family protein [Thiothrix subterranea]WML88439.1 COX15/CtaA family protein [Thiothrix subterranea]